MPARDPIIIDADVVRVKDDAPSSAANGNGNGNTSERSSAGAAGRSSAQSNKPPFSAMPKWKRIAIIVFAVLYVLSPLDLIPDWIPVVGWLDDLGVLAWAARQFFVNRTA